MAAPIKFGVGQSVLRKEDDALIRGKGRYTDDHAPQASMHALVLRSTTHLPPTWRERLGAEIDWTWSFRLAELPGGTTRLQLRVRGRTAPRWLTATYLATIIPADYIMAGGMLRGIKRRAESGALPRSSGRSPATARHAAAK